jgi:SPX domain protein involved in polyphosphate accumulation
MENQLYTLANKSGPDALPKSRADYRYERKFRTTSHGLNELIEIIRSSTGMFSESYSSRIVNSIYLDTLEQDFCSDNLAGISTRIKPRIRWYGPRQSSIDVSKLELKYKVNLLGTKASFPFPPFSLGASFHNDMIDGLSSLCDAFPTLDFLK